MNITIAREVELPEHYQQKITGLLAKQPEQAAQGLLALIEQADKEFNGEFWNIALSIAQTAADKNESYFKALKQTAHDMFNDRLSERAATIYQILERDYEHR